MNRVVVLCIDGLDRLIQSDSVDQYGAISGLLEDATHGRLESIMPLSWELAVSHLLSGINKAQPDKHDQLSHFLPDMGIAVKHFSAIDMSSRIGHRDLLASDVTVLDMACEACHNYLQDVLILELSGYYDYVEGGGTGHSYWSSIDAGLESLLSLMPDNTIWLLIVPSICEGTDKCFFVNDWLKSKGYLLPSSQSNQNVDTADSICKYRAKDSSLHFGSSVKGEDRERVIGEIQSIKHFARRGGDLRLFSFEELYDEPKYEGAPDYFVLPRVKRLKLSDELLGQGETSHSHFSKVEANTRSSEGMLFVSGYQIEARKKLRSNDLLAIAPTVMALLTLKPRPEMQRHPFHKQFLEQVIMVDDASGHDDLGGAVQSRLTALGY